MFKILLIAVCVLAYYAQDPIDVCSDEPPVAEVAEPIPEKGTPASEMTADYATELLYGDTGDTSIPSPKRKRAAGVEVTGAGEARVAFKLATGNILQFPFPQIPCPPLLTTTTAGQELCPSYSQSYTTFWSLNGNGFCFVLFPQWQRVTQTRCKCKECRNSCPVSTGYRNYCTPRSQRTRYIWAICIQNNFIRFVLERITEYYGGCECKAYKTCFFG